MDTILAAFLPKAVMTEKIIGDCYEQLKNDLSNLNRHGIKVMNKGREVTVYASLVALAADNEMANHYFALSGKNENIISHLKIIFIQYNSLLSIY